MTKQKCKSLVTPDEENDELKFRENPIVKSKFRVKISVIIAQDIDLTKSHQAHAFHHLSMEGVLSTRAHGLDGFCVSGAVRARRDAANMPSRGSTQNSDAISTATPMAQRYTATAKTSNVDRHSDLPTRRALDKKNVLVLRVRVPKMLSGMLRLGLKRYELTQYREPRGCGMENQKTFTYL